MVSYVQNENIHNENADDLIGCQGFQQPIMWIAEPLPWESPIISYDFIVDDGGDEEELVEVLFDNDSDSDGVAEPITQSQSSRT